MQIFAFLISSVLNMQRELLELIINWQSREKFKKCEFLYLRSGVIDLQL